MADIYQISAARVYFDFGMPPRYHAEFHFTDGTRFEFNLWETEWWLDRLWYFFKVKSTPREFFSQETIDEMQKNCQFLIGRQVYKMVNKKGFSYLLFK